MPRETNLDNWSYFDYKPTFPENRGYAGKLAPSWVGEHFRRLQAYNLLESYYRNAARSWQDQSAIEQDEIDKRREYGDPYVIVQQMVASVLGTDQNLQVSLAEGDVPDPEALVQQDVLRQWMDDERFLLKLLENERNGQKLGDMVYVLGWDPDLERPRLRTYNPGFYFPVLDPEGGEETFPDKVHLAWEFERKEDGQPRRYVTRITWELVEIDFDEEDPELPPNAGLQDLPWNDGPTDITCLYSKGTWRLDDLKQNEVDTFNNDKAVWEVFEEDLGIDFIPVVHIPNTVAEEEHYGVSCLASVCQIFDDLIGTDTDLQASSATTGTPPIAVSGASLPVDENGKVASYGPGTVWQTGDGNATMIDTSQSLDALLKYKDALLSRLSVNARIPESLLGRIKPSEVPSGITLALSFTPHSSTIREMRQVRRDKYSLLFKFISRFFQQAGVLTNIFPAELHFGSFMPSDRKETVDLVVQLLNTQPPCISLTTAIKMLVEAGFPIEDAAEEVQRIISEDFESALQMMDVTGDPNLVRARIGLPPLPAPEPLPEPTFDEGIPSPELL